MNDWASRPASSSNCIMNPRTAPILPSACRFNERPWLLCLGVSLALLTAVSGRAQPSGGPYGPLHVTYTPPTDAAHTYYVAPDGEPDASGSTVEAPTTIESAIARAVTGDALILRGGTYRTGNLQLNQGITIQPYADEIPVLKGTRVAADWVPQENGLWRASWSPLFPSRPESWWRRYREGARTPLYLFNNDMVFIDGRPLRTVGWEGEVDADSFSIDYDSGTVYLGTDPTGHVIEITAFDNAITRVTGEAHGRASDHRGPVIRGLTFTQYACRAIEIEGTNPDGISPESAHGKEVVGTTLENVTLSHCSRVGAYLRGDKLTVRHCLVSDTSTEGIFILSSNDVLLEKNIFRRNNVENITGYYPSGVKIFNQCHRVTCRDNLVIDQPNSNGIWYDVGNVDGVFVDNWVEGALDGFFFEISKGAICAGNVFVNCDKGIRVLNSSNVHAYQNTLVNTVASFERTTRSAVGDHFDWHPATGPGVDEREGHVFVNNLLIADDGFSKALLRVEQVRELCGRLTRPALTALDHNVYVRRGDPGTAPLLVWSPADTDTCLVELASPAELHDSQPQFAGHSRYLPHYRGPVLQSSELRNFRLLPDFPAADAAAPLPAAVAELLGWTPTDQDTPGAYPVQP